MKRMHIALVVAGLALLPTLVAAHPPAADPHNSCVVDYGWTGERSPTVRVIGTLSYFAPLGTSITQRCLDMTIVAPPGFPPYPPVSAEWGSHADPCPAPPAVGAVTGAYCGPVVPPGGTATCTWRPLLVDPTGIQGERRLVIGFDGSKPSPYNGVVNLVTDGEIPVFGGPNPLGFPPGAWTVPNPYPFEARVIGFPTLLGPYPPGLLAPLDVNEVVCVTP